MLRENNYPLPFIQSYKINPTVTLLATIQITMTLYYQRTHITNE